jgi:Uma2 family endonuclease
MPRAMADTATRKLTHADYLLFPEDGQRHQLIDGEHVVTPAPRLRHQLAVGNLHLLLASFVREHRLGRVVVSPMDAILSDHDVLQPDVLFVSAGNRAILQDWVRGAPDLVVEVLSPSTRRLDETRKRDVYERCGVTEYWLVDPDAETVKVYRLVDSAYGRPELLSARDGDLLGSPLLPGLAEPVAAVFADT